MSDLEMDYLSIILQQFTFFKKRAEQTMAQLSEEELHWKPMEESNSIAIIIKHISGNMHSRWIDFLSTDGEKSYRNRELEFEAEWESKESLMQKWEAGWKLLFQTIEQLDASDLHKTVTLRKQPLNVLEAIQIEVAHISYHLGQIVYIGKQIRDKEWVTLSIPKAKK